MITQCSAFVGIAKNMTRLQAVAWVVLLTPAVLFPQDRTETIAQTGQSAPNGNGTFSSFDSATINGIGQVAFDAQLTGTAGGASDNAGLFRGSGGAITQVVRKGQAAPNGNGTFSLFFAPVMNDLGEVAFQSTLIGTSGGASDDGGLFRGSGGSITQIAREGQAAPDGNGTFSFASIPSLNGSGSVAFQGFLAGTVGGSSDDEGVFRSNGGAITQIARAAQSAPDANGVFSIFGNPSINNANQAAFFAILTGTNGGSSDNTGIFLGSGGAVTQIARAGQAAPDGNGVFSGFSSPGQNPVLNDVGQAAFRANLTGTSGGSSDSIGIFRGSGGAITQIARAGQTAPDGNGAFSFFQRPSQNNAGQSAFVANLTGTSGGGSDSIGVFRGSGGAITQIARAGQTAPDGNGTFSFFLTPSLNDAGQAAFFSGLTGTSGGSNDNQGIFTGDGIDLIQVARMGNALAGSTITSLTFSLSGGLNQHGQITYIAGLANGNQFVSRWTPAVHWRTDSSGSWDSASQWTLGLAPSPVHDVLIDPAASLSVSGPSSDRTVRSLQIGGGSGFAMLTLSQDTVLTATHGVSIESTGVLSGVGTIRGDVDSAGEIRPGNSAGRIEVDGTLSLLSSSVLTIELGGQTPGKFDQLVVSGDLSLAGDLLVTLIDGHTLGFNREYLIADVGGMLSGEFDGLEDGDLVGNFGGYDLFIAYHANGGNQIALFTAVPEPSTGILAVAVALAWLFRRRRLAHGDRQ